MRLPSILVSVGAGDVLVSRWYDQNTGAVLSVFVPTCGHLCSKGRPRLCPLRELDLLHTLLQRMAAKQARPQHPKAVLKVGFGPSLAGCAPEATFGRGCTNFVSLVLQPNAMPPDKVRASLETGQCLIRPCCS